MTWQGSLSRTRYDAGITFAAARTAMPPAWRWSRAHVIVRVIQNHKCCKSGGHIKIKLSSIPLNC
jgi:hypothetical protein